MLENSTKINYYENTIIKNVSELKYVCSLVTLMIVEKMPEQELTAGN
jgi:hypothetical protein